MVNLSVSGSVDVLDIVFPLRVVSLQVDLVGERSGGLLKLTRELFKDNAEIVLLISLTDSPVLR